jgi:hypothetical protein
MRNFYPELNQKIQEISEGDEEFRVELTQAIYVGLLELKEQYLEGFKKKDGVVIQQVRHKVKPTLSMFQFDQLIETLQKGKEILDAQGFVVDFTSHLEDFKLEVDRAIHDVSALNK